ncbi:MAG: CheR family methyltransferase [bacterium]
MVTDQDKVLVSRLISDRLGLQFPVNRWRDLERSFISAGKEIGYESAEAIVSNLLKETFSDDHFTILAEKLTIGETYFFREKPGLDHFRSRILPELIEKRRNGVKSIRIWSAGCCTGEEPYTLAMILSEAIPDISGWKITLLATDINASFIKKARSGIYGAWSFRDSPEEIKSKYFTQSGKDFRINQEIIKLVTFSELNLAGSNYPSVETNTASMDVIFCRNVLMYFAKDQIAQVGNRFYSSLAEDGWLILNPIEISGELFPLFTQRNIFNTVALQKSNADAVNNIKVDKAELRSKGNPDHKRSAKKTSYTPSLPKNSVKVPVSPPLKKNVPEDPLKKIHRLFEKKQHNEVIRIADQLLINDPANTRVIFLLIRLFANAGDLESAKKWCQKLIVVDEMSAVSHYTMGMLMIEMNELPEAEKSLSRSLYLDPGHLMSYFLLGNVMKRQNKQKNAEKYFRNLYSLLSKIPDETIIPESDEMTAGNLKKLAETLVTKKK